MSVAGPYIPRHPSPLRRHKQSRQSTSYQASVVPPLPPSDPLYGHSEAAYLCQRFIQALFSCPNRPPHSTTSPSTTTPGLAAFVAYALHRTRLHTSVTFTALFLLSRLKSRFPAARGSSGHRLFISAFMIASKVVCDDTYSNKSWTVVGQGMFSLREINQMEREMCGYLEWLLNVDPKELEEFEDKVRKEYAPNGPCPAFVHPPLPASSASSSASSSSSSSGASLNPLQTTSTASSAASMSDISLAPHLVTPPESPHRRASLPRASSRASSTALPALPAPPTHVLMPTPIDVRPATPQLGSHDSDSPSPASSTTCLTPQSDDDDADDATIVSTFMHSDMSAETGGPTRTNSALSMISASLPPKSKKGRDPSFAYPSRTVW